MILTGIHSLGFYHECPTIGLPGMLLYCGRQPKLVLDSNFDPIDELFPNDFRAKMYGTLTKDEQMIAIL